MTTESLLSPRELAEAIVVKLSWVYSKAEAGEIPCYKIGKYLRFRPSEIAAWIDAQRVEARAEAAGRADLAEFDR